MSSSVVSLHGNFSSLELQTRWMGVPICSMVLTELKKVDFKIRHPRGCYWCVNCVEACVRSAAVLVSAEVPSEICSIGFSFGLRSSCGEICDFHERLRISLISPSGSLASWL